MTGPQHYQTAEELMYRLPDDYDAAESVEGTSQSILTLQRAQVHATLALAAATAYPAIKDYSGDEDGRESRGWAGVTS